MFVNRIIYQLYSMARWIARTLGFIKPLRKYLGPLTGRLMFDMFSYGNKQIMVRGHVMKLAAQGRFPPANMLRDNYEKQTTELFERIVKPGMVVFDIGAHVGYYTLLAARQIGDTGEVHAFEPEPSNFNLLAQNVEFNNYQNVECVNKVVSNDTGSTELFLTSLDNGRYSIYNHGLPKKRSVLTQSISLDDYVNEKNLTKIDLIKVDVEGAETDVLNGAVKLLNNRNVRNVIIEFNPGLLQNAGVSPREFLVKPSSWRFNISYIDEDKGLLHLPKDDVDSFIGELLKNEASVNLFWTQ